jgi:hypothetical protein
MHKANNSYGLEEGPVDRCPLLGLEAPRWGGNKRVRSLTIGEVGALCIGFFASRTPHEKWAEYETHQRAFDTEKVGEVYVVMYSAGCEGTETTQTIRAHHSVVVDIYGESTLHDIVGYESVTHNPDLKSLKWILLGKIDLPKEQLGQAEKELQRFAVTVFGSLTQNGRTWSDAVNCQQYCRLFVEQLLGCSVPYLFSVIGLNSLPEWLRGYEPFAINVAIQYLTCAHYAGLK